MFVFTWFDLCGLIVVFDTLLYWYFEFVLAYVCLELIVCCCFILLWVALLLILYWCGYVIHVCGL